MKTNIVLPDLLDDDYSDILNQELKKFLPDNKYLFTYSEPEFILQVLYRTEGFINPDVLKKIYRKYKNVATQNNRRPN